MARINPPAAMAKTGTSTAGIKGFTLLELIIVLFIIAASASIVVVSSGRLRDKTIFNEETRGILLTLKRARTISLMERKSVEFIVNEDGNQYRITSGGNENIYMHALPRGYSISGESVYFFPKGNSSGGTIKISDGKDLENNIEIDPVLGKATVRRI